MSLIRKARHFAQLLAAVALIGASPADAQIPGIEYNQNSSVLADQQGIALAISNYTPFTMAARADQTNANVNGPGFPSVLLPAQHSGTGVFLRGGLASEGVVAQYYEFVGLAPAGLGASVGLPFGLVFWASTDWDFKAAASDVLHAVKSKVSSEAKDSLKDDAKKGGDDALKAAGAEDGMTEVIETMKVIEGIAKLFKALDPQYALQFGWTLADEEYPFYSGEKCISKNTADPPANIVIVGPAGQLTAESADNFYALSALSVNAEYPGFVDASITPMCAYACAAFNASNDWLNDYTQDECNSQFTGSNTTAAVDVYNGYDTLNVCIRTAADGPAGVSWVTPPTNTIERWHPDGSQCVQDAISYPVITDSICGVCPSAQPQPQPQPQQPSGSWQESCEQTSWDSPTLCADCALRGGVLYSCASCSSGEFTNADGTLVCANSAAASSDQTLNFLDLSPRSPFFEQLAVVQLPDLSKPFSGERR